MTSEGRARRNDLTPRTISKGSRIYRSGTKDSKFMNRDYAYVDITPHRWRHDSQAGLVYDTVYNGTNRDNMRTYVMKAKKDLKLATAANYLDACCKVAGIDTSKKVKDIPNRVVNQSEYEALTGHYYGLKVKNIDITYGLESPIANKARDYIKSQGFDGYEDPVDSVDRIGRTQSKLAPMVYVVFNPKENLQIDRIEDF